ncbi:uncharacterized protein METZ01_LOCUS92721 [marine metagenome]|uniref:SGNH hydrolase-type esterase domain-containing protein n=1 Tax=marine metagenome TaxID=408172 RepID=A0A381VJM7_9ZZZZ
MGNEYIFSSILDRIFEKDIGLVIAMWSEVERLDYQQKFDSDVFDWVNIHMHRSHSTKAPDGTKNMVRNIFNIFGIGGQISLLKKSIRLFYSFQTIMENLDIPYLQIMGPYPCDKLDFKKSSEEILMNIFGDKINEKTFLGWPIFPEIGGSTIDRVLDKIDPKRNKLRINYPTDSHPNSLGHKVICDYLYKEVEKKWQFTSY